MSLHGIRSYCMRYHSYVFTAAGCHTARIALQLQMITELPGHSDRMTSTRHWSQQDACRMPRTYRGGFVHPAGGSASLQGHVAMQVSRHTGRSEPLTLPSQDNGCYHADKSCRLRCSVGFVPEPNPIVLHSYLASASG